MLSGRLITVVVSFVATPFVVRGLGDARYGVFATMTMISSLLLFSDLGVGSGLVTTLAKVVGVEDRSAGRQLVASALLILTAASLVVGVCVCAVALFLPVDALLGAPPGDEQLVRHSVLAYAILFAAGVPAGLGQRVLMAMQRGAHAAAWTTVLAVLTSLLPAVAAMSGASLLVVVLAAMLPPAALGGVQTAWVLLRQFPDLRPRVRDFKRARTTALARSSGAFVVLQLAIAIGFQTDIFVVAALLGPTQAATYSLSLRLFGLAGMAASMVSVQFWAAAADALARGDMAWVRRTYRRLTAITTAVAGGSSIALLLAGQTFIAWWVGDSLVPPVSLLVAMALWTTWVAFLQPTAMLLNGAHVLRVQVVTAILMAAINLPLSILFTRQWGVTGPVVASLLASVATTGVPCLLACRQVLSGQRS
jgi:O-antigen/teichoic acid export membrane protein